MKRSMQTLVPALLAVFFAATTSAATISLGDPTTELDGDLFIDDTSTGGGDTVNPPPPAFNPSRFFDLDGLAGAPGVPGTVTIQGFGIATNNNAAQNSAESVTLTFTYLGANEAVGGGDDLVIGSETVLWNDPSGPAGWNGAGTYFVNLDTDPSLFIDGLGERFRITIAPNNGSVRFKQATGIGIKLSVSGTFVAIPEPSSLLAMGIPAVFGLVRRGSRS